MFRYICILSYIISVALCAELFPVGDNVFCDREDETKVYIGTYPITCNKGWRCNMDYRNNQQYCVQTSTCNKFTCVSDKLVRVYDGSLLNCGAGKVCNSINLWPCEPCLIEACIRQTYKCDSTNNKLVHILEPQEITMMCPGNKVCNKNNIYPCEWCIADNGAEPPTESVINCNDGFGAKDKNPCRRGSDSNTSVYFRCKAVWYWYEYEVVSCDKLSTDSICKDKVYWCN